MSSENGGAVAIDRAALQIINSTLSGNAADNFGGGVWSYGVNNSVAMFHSTMTDNTADANSSGVGGGGGIWVDDGGAVTLDNTLVAANSDNSGTAPDIGSDVTLAFSLIGDSTGATLTDQGGNLIGTAAMPMDPLLTPLNDNGGSTWRTRHARQPDFGCRRSGRNSRCRGRPLNDQRQVAFDRVSDGNGDLTDRIDIGAHKAQSFPNVLLVDNPIDEDNGNVSAGDISLREAVRLANLNTQPTVIRFDDSMVDQTIVLSNGELPVSNSITMIGLGAERLTIDANHSSRIFSIDDGLAAAANILITGMTLTGGSTSGDGGAIDSQENLHLRDIIVTDSSANEGGGVFASQVLTLTRTNVHGNSAVRGQVLRREAPAVTIPQFPSNVQPSMATRPRNMAAACSPATDSCSYPTRHFHRIRRR